MQRIACDERPDWKTKAEAAGFRFHTISGERYWDERAYYAFTLSEIEDDIEAPTGELDAMCRELVARAVADERMLKVLHIPERFWTFIAASWKRGDRASMAGSISPTTGRDPRSCSNTMPTRRPRCSRPRCSSGCGWRTRRRRAITPKDADQYNSLHERLIEGWKEIGKGGHVHLAGAVDDPEDGGTIAYMEDTARQAGLATTVMPMDQIGRTPKGVFVDLANKPIELMFKLYPWEWMFREQFGASLAGAPTRWLEPPWKAILSNKGILPLLWAMFPRHPNLLPAYFEDDAKAAELGNSFVRKPLYSREGSNVTIMVGGQAVDQDQGPYGEEGFVRQAVATLPQYEGNYAAIGSWIAAGKPCGLSVREDVSPITKNTSRFLPHAIVG